MCRCWPLPAEDEDRHRLQVFAEADAVLSIDCMRAQVSARCEVNSGFAHGDGTVNVLGKHAGLMALRSPTSPPAGPNAGPLLRCWPCVVW